MMGKTVADAGTRLASAWWDECGYRKTAKYAEESTQPMGKTKERQGI